MARLGFNASLSFKNGSSTVSGSGIKDLSIEVTSKEVPIESRGFDFIRYLRGQKDVPLDFAVEADSPCVPILRAAYWAAPGSSAENVETTITNAGGDTMTGTFIVTKFGFSAPVAGEEEYNVSMRLSATVGLEDQPTHTPNATD